MKLLAKTYQVTEAEFIASDADLAAYKELLLAKKQGQEITEEQQEFLDAIYHKVYMLDWVERGWNWRVKIVDAADNNKLLYEVPKFCQTEWHAARYGERAIRTFNETGGFDPQGLRPEIKVNE